MESIGRTTVVNRMLSLKVDGRLNLKDLERRLPNRNKLIPCGKTFKPSTSLHLGRPTMLTWRRLKKEKLLTILFFPNGTIQCVGSCEDNLTSEVHSDLENLLGHRLAAWSVRTMTVLCDLQTKFDFRKLNSSKLVTYEIDLFPAAQVTAWSPYHVHIFHNGKIIITGVKDLSCVADILKDIKRYMSLRTLFNHK